MKKFILLIALMFSSVAFADICDIKLKNKDMKSDFIGGEITYNNVSAQQCTVIRDKYKRIHQELEKEVKLSPANVGIVHSLAF